MGGYAMQGEVRHEQRTKINPLNIQPTQNQPQTNSHQPNYNPSHPNPNSACTTTIPYHIIVTTTQPNSYPPHSNPSSTQPIPILTPPSSIPTAYQPNPSNPILLQPNLNLTHFNLTPFHTRPIPTQPTQLASHLILTAHQHIPPPPCPNPCPTQSNTNPHQPAQHTSYSLQSNSHNPTHSAHTTPKPIQLTQPQLNITHAITFRGEEIAKLVACGIKHIENRNFSIGNGTLIAIAVGKKAADPKEVAALHTILTPHNPSVDLLTLTEPTMRGHIIGVCRISHTLAHDECRQSKWADSRWKYCNIITEAIQLPKPIPAKGNLGKWLLNKDVQLAITQQLQGIKLIPNGAAELYPCIKHGTQSTLP